MNKIAEFLSDPQIVMLNGECRVKFKSSIPAEHPLSIIPAAKSPQTTVAAKLSDTFAVVIGLAKDQIWADVQAYIEDWKSKLSAADGEAKK